MAANGFDYDVIVIGSGFGGSVAAMRATEKGYRVGVMESGKRWNDEDIPHTNWDVRRFAWQPELGQSPGPQASDRARTRVEKRAAPTPTSIDVMDLRAYLRGLTPYDETRGARRQDSDIKAARRRPDLETRHRRVPPE